MLEEPVDLSPARPDPETAWMSKDAARWYARDVNDRFYLEQLDLSFQVKLLSSLISDSARIADIGCGTGALSLLLAKRGYEVTGFDISASMLQQLSRRSSGLSISVVEADIFELGAEQGLFDAAVSRWVVPHFSDWGRILQSVGHILRPGGVFVFDLKNKEHFDFAISPQSTVPLGHDDQQPSDGLKPDQIDPYTSYPLAFAHTASDSQIREILGSSGFTFEARYSLGLLSDNLLLAGDITTSEMKKRVKEINRLVRRSSTLRLMLESVAESLTPHVPPHLVARSIVVARRVSG